jgi:hypothetical protein
MNARQRAYRRKHPMRARAWVLARRLRTATPTACEWCGARGPVERHHFDYSRPAEVEWLCKRDHVYADFLRRIAEAERRRHESTSGRP